MDHPRVFFQSFSGHTYTRSYLNNMHSTDQAQVFRHILQNRYLFLQLVLPLSHPFMETVEFRVGQHRRALPLIISDPLIFPWLDPQKQESRVVADDDKGFDRSLTRKAPVFILPS
jgi:hypothetical protein